MIINPNVVSLSNEQLKAISAAEPATIGHFRNFGFNNQPLFISLPGKRFIGRAVTCKLASNDSTLLHKVTEMVGPGDVLIIDRAGDQQYAALGGVVSWALHVSGVEGVIVDGAATDIDEIRDELIADAVGLYAAYGRFDRELAMKFLGIRESRDGGGCSYTGGRLGNYTSDPEAIVGRVCAALDRIGEICDGFDGESVFELIKPLMEGGVY